MRCAVSLRDGDWFALERGNDWGSVYFARRRLTPPRYPGDTGAADSARRYRLEAGEQVRARLKSGRELEGRIVFKTHRESVGDHGHSYDATSNLPFVDFGDGLIAAIDDVELRYEVSRDPTAAELGGAT